MVNDNLTNDKGAVAKGAVVVWQVSEFDSKHVPDLLAVEEPLEIRLSFNTGSVRETKSISVTMRTPGDDEALAVGFLYTEGIITEQTKFEHRTSNVVVCREGSDNTIVIHIDADCPINLKQADRNFYTTSSCGVCGKSSIAAIRTVSSPRSYESEIIVKNEILRQLPAIMKNHQVIFSSTGGLHACGLFNPDGKLIDIKEDVGRHNALDKLIGSAFLRGRVELSDHILLLSGRASFELIQKAAMAGIRIVASIGAPSSLAVSLAAEFNITLVGFLRPKSFNLYTGLDRIK